MLMRRIALLALVVVGFAGAGQASAAPPHVLAVHFDAEVNPVTQGYINHEIGQAEKKGYDAVVIVMDTPGGLSDSMRKIYLRELSARIPVLCYVSPSGARAASAGVWICEAADVAAMAPGTNIGSSTPIQGNGQNIGSDLRRKVINDAAASLRGLMRGHGRNPTWGDLAVRKASNRTDQEALQQHIVDFVAPSLPGLLQRADGFRTKFPGRHFTLHLAEAQIDDVHMGFFARLLNTLIDPNIITLLFLAGIAGLGYEIFHPGVVLPGALGAVALVLSLAAGLGLFWALALTKAVQARRRPVSVGPQEIIGQVGEMRRDGMVAVRGELWRAKVPEGLEVQPGQPVEISGVEDGLVLDVKPLEPAAHE